MNADQVGQHPRVAAGNCLASHTARQVVIYDHKNVKGPPAPDPRIDGHCYLRQPREETTPFDFTVRNPSGQVFHFVAVDKCMFTDQDAGRRCDCLVFTENVALFIDLKENKSVASRKKGRLDAIK